MQRLILQKCSCYAAVHRRVTLRYIVVLRCGTSSCYAAVHPLMQQYAFLLLSHSFSKEKITSWEN